jgi:hypothetical protein
MQLEWLLTVGSAEPMHGIGLVLDTKHQSIAAGVKKRWSLLQARAPKSGCVSSMSSDGIFLLWCIDDAR